MRTHAWAALKALLLLSLLLPFLPSAKAQTVLPRITQAVDNAKRVALRGNVHPLARHQFDRGVEPDSLLMDHMFLLLTRSPEQESALQTFLTQQQDKSSPEYHHWLTPEQFGEKFGPSDADLKIIHAWLSSQGFQAISNSNGRTLIGFSGNAGLVRAAFRTEIHRFVVNGEEHWANIGEPQIPAALAPALGGLVGLNNFHLRPMHRASGIFSRSKATGQVKPLFTFSGGVCSLGLGLPSPACYAVGPFDFAAIYNVLPLWNSGIDGTGQTIAVVGRSNINLQDVRDFRSLFGLPAKDPVVIIPPGNSDPGQTGDENESEADLDVEWSGAVAKNATIDLVTAASSASDGAIVSAMYVVDANLAPVLSVSFGACELSLGSSGNKLFNGLWQQAAAQGITVLVAAGDQGSATCDVVPPGQPAELGLAVSGIASTPFNVAVGGTDFDDLGNQAKFWNATNDSTTQASAKGYIPEAAWNDSCANPELFSMFASTSAEANCNNSAAQRSFLVVAGGGGGASRCTSPTGTVPSSCSGGYAKPSWQTGNGVPHDGKRDIPDVSLFASDGPINASFYIVCQADQIPGNSCNLGSPFTNFLGVGGTSASSPAFAGIMALVNQKTSSTQGNANPILYNLAAQDSQSACNSSLGPATTCIFNDVTSGNIAMPCANPSPNCKVSNSTDLVGTLSGFDAGAGYDLATGLGSVNAANLVNDWASNTVGSFSLSPNPASVHIAAAGQSGASTITVTGTNGFAGSVTFTCRISPVPANDAPTCFVFPFSVALSATTTSAAVSLQISTTSGLSGAVRPSKHPNKPGYFAASAGLALGCIFLLAVPRPRGRRTAFVEWTLLVLFGVGLIGCARGPGVSTQINLGTPSGSYTATIVGSGGGRSQTTTVSLTVQ